MLRAALLLILVPLATAQGDHAERFRQRFGSTAEERVAAGQADPRGAQASARAAAWLVSVQARDGSWTAHGTPGEGDVTATALALLALMGEGEAHLPSIELGGMWLAGCADTDGVLGDTRAHLIGTLALAEFAHVADSPARALVRRRALEHAGSTRVLGGWDEDPVLTAWGAWALHAGEHSLRAPTADWLSAVTRDSGAVRRKRGAPGTALRPLAAVYVARRLLGAEPEDVRALALRVQDPKHEPEWPGTHDQADLQAWMWQAWAATYDARYWPHVRDRMAAVLSAAQADDGAWPSMGTPGECRGRVESTALCVLTLGAGYRYPEPVARPTQPAPAAGPAPPSPFDDKVFNDVIGLSGPDGGALAPRFRVKTRDRAAGEALARSLEWLVAAQNPDGSWSSGDGDHDVEVTSAAVLAFMADGSSLRRGPHKVQVVKGIKWLRDQQDFATGRFDETGAFGHALATTAMTEAYVVSKSPLLKRTVQKAIDHLVKLEEHPGHWQGGTVWAVHALLTAGEAGSALAVSAGPGVPGLDWLASRGGFEEEGIPGSDALASLGGSYVALAWAGRERDEPDYQTRLTGHGPSLADEPAALMLATLAAHQMEGALVERWIERALALVLETIEDDHSTAPRGRFGAAGGRVWSTAMTALTLAADHRYARFEDER